VREAPSLRKKRRPVVFIASLDGTARSKWRKALGKSFSVHERGGITGLARVLSELKPAILLLDLNLRRLSGISNLPPIQRLSPLTKIIVLTNSPKLTEEVSALKLGAKGYSGREISEDLLRKAVRLVQQGELWTRRRIIGTLLEELLTANWNRGEPLHRQSRVPLESLTSKKRAIVRFITDGLTNKEIARRLNVSEATVKAHLTTIFRTFAVSNRAQLAALVGAEIKIISTRSITKHA
jgi:two-component system nitrate/nitrite response regulator NarL